MSEETNHYRRHFCGLGPSVAELVIIGTVDAHPSQPNPSNAITTKPGTNTSFATGMITKRKLHGVYGND